ncbi:MAG: hypothetical protein HPY60_00280 [Candidatus Methanofastidiosum sp.]|nr:hypothetical protein [Methanofastidiosum sp.]
MKKIMAILISLLFAVTTLTSVTGFCEPSDKACYIYCLICNPSPCSPCGSYCNIYGPSLVHVGDIITVEIYGFDCNLQSSAFIFCDNFEVISSDKGSSGGTGCGCGTVQVYKLRALSPGVVGATFTCNENKLNITVTPKEYPMHQFMKILEKNKGN